MTQVRITKNVTETYSRVRVGKHLSDVSLQEWLEKRRCFNAIAFKLCFRICHYEGSGKPERLEIKGTQQLLIFSDDVNIIGGSVNTMTKKAETLVVARKEF